MDGKKLVEIAEALGARIVTQGPTSSVAIDRVYAGDRISDLLDRASPRTLLVTNLASRQLLRLADVMDVPAICFAGGRQPEAEVIDAANVRGTALLVSPVEVYETCGRLYRLLGEREGGAP